MALTANTANVQILEDSSTKTIVKLLLHQTSGDESDALKVNVETLSCRTFTLNITNAAVEHSTFVAGEKITGQTSGAIGYALDYRAATPQLDIVLESGTFEADEEIVGAVSGKTVTVSTITTPTRTLDILSVWHSVTGAAKVELAFDDNGTKVPIIHLAGNGYFGKNNYATKIPNAAAVPNGNLYASTYGVDALGGYCLIVELRKVKGFAGRPVY